MAAAFTLARDIPVMTTERTLGEMLQEALARKASDLGRYSYRDLERDSKVNYSYVSKAISGRRPSREVIHAWSQALSPYLPEDEALVAAGYLPEVGRRASALRRLAHLPVDALERALDFIGAAGGGVDVRKENDGDGSDHGSEQEGDNQPSADRRGNP
jgi:hypothetical protein